MRSMLIVIFISAIIPLSANAAVVTYLYTGEIIEVLEDTGAGIYAGTSPGDAFSGSLRYSADPLDASETEIDLSSPPAVQSLWSFNGGSFGGTLSDGLTTAQAPTVELTIDSNFAVESQDEADFFNSLLTQFAVSPGDLFDVWDTNTEYGLANGIYFGVSLITFDEGLYTGFDFEPFPLELQQYDIAIFGIEERINGEVVYESYGLLNAGVSEVPIPAAAWLFGSALIALAGIKRNN